MPAAGEGYRLHITGLTHDEQGYPAMHAEAHAAMVSRITEKIRNSLDAIVRTEAFMLDDADIVIVSYGCSARTAFAAVEDARRAGIRAGMLRLVTVWPFPEKQIRELAARVRGFVTVEINLGQVHLEVERCAGGKAPAVLVGHAGGTIIAPEEVLNAVRETFSYHG
jgi:2-oxoglutarate ferredoxin oxidoreductase subunit alpha